MKNSATTDPFSYIRQNVSLLGYAQTITELKPSSDGRFRGKCPVHGGDNPSSFSVDDERGLWHCFSCGERGSVIDLYALINDRPSNSRETLNEIAQHFSLRLPERVKKSVVTEKAVIQALEWITEQCHKALVHKPSGDAAVAYEYLMFRFTPNGEQEPVEWVYDAIDEYRIGFLSRAILKDAEKKFDREVLEEAGVIRSRGDGSSTYCQFVGRIIFPLTRKRDNKVIGLCGRIVPPFVYQDQEYEGIKTLTDGKYINPVNGLVYNKSVDMYDATSLTVEGIHSVVVCEGYMDSIALNMNLLDEGIAAVSASGTALTTQHADLIFDASDSIGRVYLMTDGDQAGNKSAIAGAWLPYRYHGETISFYNASRYMPDGCDPFDVLLQGDGLDTVLSVISQAQESDLGLSSIRFMWEELGDSERFFRWMNTIYRKIEDKDGEQSFLADVAKISGIPLAKIALEVRQNKSTSADDMVATSVDDLDVSPAALSLIRYALSLSASDDPGSVQRLKHSYLSMYDLDSVVLRKWLGFSSEYEVEAMRCAVLAQVPVSTEATVILSDLSGQSGKVDVDAVGRIVSLALAPLSKEVKSLPSRHYETLRDEMVRLLNVTKDRSEREHFLMCSLSDFFELAASILNATIEEDLQ